MKHEFPIVGAALRRDSCAASRHKAAPTGTIVVDLAALPFCHSGTPGNSLRDLRGEGNEYGCDFRCENEARWASVSAPTLIVDVEIDDHLSTSVHQQHREESMRAYVTSWSRPWILYFVQNDGRGMKTGPGGFFTMVGRDRWARRSNPKSRIQNRK